MLPEQSPAKRELLPEQYPALAPPAKRKGYCYYPSPWWPNTHQKQSRGMQLSFSCTLLADGPILMEPGFILMEPPAVVAPLGSTERMGPILMDPPAVA